MKQHLQSTLGDLQVEQVSVIGALLVWGWTEVGAEDLLQRTGLQALDSTQEPALNIASEYQPN